MKKNRVVCITVPDSIPQDETYSSFVRKAIKNCDVFLLILSKNILNSKWIPKEIEYALENEKEIIQIVLEDIQLTDQFKFLLSNTNSVDLKSNDFNNLNELLIKHKKMAKKIINDSVQHQSSDIDTIRNKEIKEEENVKPENGLGKYIYEDDTIYEGEWHKSKRCGYGIITKQNGDRFYAMFDDDKIIDFYIYIPSDGYPTYGKMINNVTHIEPAIEKMIYDEDLVANVKNIVKKKKYKDGDTYYGMQKLFCRNMFGIMNYKIGEKYVGLWSIDNRHGFGSYYYNDGSIYYGFWNFDFKEGIGVQVLENGDVFSERLKKVLVNQE